MVDFAIINFVRRIIPVIKNSWLFQRLNSFPFLGWQLKSFELFAKSSTKKKDFHR